MAKVQGHWSQNRLQAFTLQETPESQSSLLAASCCPKLLIALHRFFGFKTLHGSLSCRKLEQVSLNIPTVSSRLLEMRPRSVAELLDSHASPEKKRQIKLTIPLQEKDTRMIMDA